MGAAGYAKNVTIIGHVFYVKMNIGLKGVLSRQWVLR